MGQKLFSHLFCLLVSRTIRLIEAIRQYFMVTLVVKWTFTSTEELLVENARCSRVYVNIRPAVSFNPSLAIIYIHSERRVFVVQRLTVAVFNFGIILGYRHKRVRLHRHTNGRSHAAAAGAKNKTQKPTFGRTSAPLPDPRRTEASPSERERLRDEHFKPKQGLRQTHTHTPSSLQNAARPSAPQWKMEVKAFKRFTSLTPEFRHVFVLVLIFKAWKSIWFFIRASEVFVWVLIPWWDEGEIGKLSGEQRRSKWRRFAPGLKSS